MLGLLYKDIRVNRWWLLTIFGISLFFNLTIFFGDFRAEEGADLIAKLVGFLMYGAAFFTGGACSLIAVQNDERRKWTYYVTSLPNGIAKQVICKYVLSLLVLAVVFAVCIVQNTISLGLSSGYEDLVGMLLLFAALTLIMVGLELPFATAFGTKAGGYVKAGIFVAAVFAVLVYFMFGDISWVGSSDDLATSAFDFIAGFDFMKAAKKVWLAAAPIYAVSCFISTKVYLFGTDRMEK